MPRKWIAQLISSEEIFQQQTIHKFHIKLDESVFASEPFKYNLKQKLKHDTTKIHVCTFNQQINTFDRDEHRNKGKRQSSQIKLQAVPHQFMNNGIVTNQGKKNKQTTLH